MNSRFSETIKRLLSSNNPDGVVIVSSGVAQDVDITKGLSKKLVIALNDALPDYEPAARILSIDGLDQRFDGALLAEEIFASVLEDGQSVFNDVGLTNINTVICDWTKAQNINPTAFGASILFANYIFSISNWKIARLDLVGFGEPEKDNAIISSGGGRVREANIDYTRHIYSLHHDLIRRLKESYRAIGIFITHVGSTAESDISLGFYQKLNGGYYNENLEQIKSVIESPSRRRPSNVKVVAEITTNHYGDLNRLKALICEAAVAGAHGIKLQVRDINKLYSKEKLDESYVSPFGDTFRDYRQALELQRADWVTVSDYSRRLNLFWGVSVLDIGSYEFIKTFKPDFIKLPSTISEHLDLIEHVGADWGGELVFSTGFTDDGYDSFVVSKIKRAKAIYILQCTSSYPCRESDTNIRVIATYIERYKADPRVRAGFSSHDIGSLCSMLAIACGAKMIEKHIRFGKVDWGHFDGVAIDVTRGELRSFVNDMVRAEAIMGSGDKAVVPSEDHKYRRK